MPTKFSQTFVLLEEGSGDTVIVNAKDRDTFCVKVEAAVNACRMIDAGYSFILQVGELKDHLAAWIEPRKERIHAAYLTLRPQRGLLFLVVQREVKCDHLLVDDLTELDIAVAGDERFQLLNMDVLSLPKSSRDALDAFLSSGQVIQYANHDGARDSGEGEQTGNTVPA